MKKVLITRLVGLLALLVSLPIYSDTIIDGLRIPDPSFESGGVYYYIGGDNVSVVPGKIQYSGDIVIPDQVSFNGNTYSVTGIWHYAFQYSSLTSITIPKSLTWIGENAFYGCSHLNSVHISDLESWLNVGIEELRRMASSPIPLAHHLYVNGQEVKDLVIPNTMISISYCSFRGWSFLTSVTIPNSVISIGNYAFENCSGLTSVTIPNSVTSISSSAFENCSGLTSIKVEAGNENYDSRNNCNAIIETSSNELLVGCMNTIIPNSVTSIGSRAFHRCSGLTSITIPNSVTSIGDDAFYGCSGLTSVTIPNSVTSIGNYAFYGCNSLTSVTIGNSVTSIGNSAFIDCSGLTSITIPNSVTSIGSFAFLRCCGLTSIIIPNSVTSIGGSAFSGCSGLTSVSISNSVTSIGSSAFYNCSGLTSITIPNSVTSIGSSAFEGTAWYNNQPDGLVYAGKVAYRYKGTMPDNTQITIKEGTLGIAGAAFYNCSGLTSITIPNSVTSMDDYAFIGCKGLTTIVSEIEKPFEIYSSTFDSDTYNVAELIVPYGTRSAYQTTEGWNKFTMITEAANKDEVTFAIDGLNYQGSKSAQNVTVKSVDASRTWMEIPASINYDGTTYQVTGMADDAFKGCSMGALIWDVEAALPNNAFSSASIGSNFLLYVKSASYAPSTVKNVVVDGAAQTIALSDDGGQFYCPKTFIARSIFYTHNYTMETGGSKGWETLALPFFVQKISHSTRGEIVPFALYSSSSSQKPFWLGKISGNEFKRTSAIEANEPYIIAMPNNKRYRNEYNLAGEVTFSAENAAVPKTPTFDGQFVPAFAPVAKSSSVKALNNASYSGGYDPGSRFISNLRDVHPFEAYMTGSSSRGIIEINFDDGTTDMPDILFSSDESQEITIHTLSGQQVTRTIQRDFDAVWQQLPKGVYIINGKKMIK
jgi:hypothetical protein